MQMTARKGERHCEPMRRRRSDFMGSRGVEKPTAASVSGFFFFSAACRSSEEGQSGAARRVTGTPTFSKGTQTPAGELETATRKESGRPYRLRLSSSDTEALVLSELSRRKQSPVKSHRALERQQWTMEPRACRG
ncbi:hypothetical protein NDU88_005583 [Pleurodeles waltl]|uniref:Uncharacterized protein n=1 Tax=Pleurodeles waltl TaxID=8319 RepID=A0AAV7L186_PLEWA|nr:hypothetical protein NDU88_005583 [Pleurodeles waltl]